MLFFKTEEEKMEEIRQQGNSLLSSLPSQTLFDEAINLYSTIPDLYEQIQQFSQDPNREKIKEYYRKIFGSSIRGVL